jgi:hypothetical protein
MKKIIKTTKTPAPATKPSPPVTAPKTTVEPKVKKPALAAAPAVTKPSGARLTITAKVDVGFGNTLFIRGDGASLSWERGTPLVNEAIDKWSVVLWVEKPLAFKFLLNDTAWCAGDDYQAAPGDTVTVTPIF